jgi:hypothetical protein
VALAPQAVAAPNQTAALQETADQLKADNARLAGSIARVDAENTRLEKQKQQANQIARAFQELTATNLASTNEPMTMREMSASVGKLMRLNMVVHNPQSTPAERSASRDAMAREISRALQSKGADLDDYTPASPEEAADLGACLLHGLFVFDQQQFVDVYQLILKSEQQILQQNPQQKLQLPDPRTLLTGPSLQEIQSLLTPSQLATLNALPFQKQPQPQPAAK